MNKTIYRLISIVVTLTLAFAGYTRTQASALALESPFAKHLTPGDSTGWNFETSGSAEKITTTTDGWIMQAGGNVASTHYARAKYKLPEQNGLLLTTFYMKAVVVLPADFYTQQKAGFRIMTTDNYATTLNSVSVGATNANELRTGVYIYSDHGFGVNTTHQNGGVKTLYRTTTPLPVGEHTLELFGDVSAVAAWYFKVDGQMVASGVDRLSPDDTPVNEQVITRFVAGIDGASDQSDNAMNVTVKSFDIANYDMSGASPAPIPPTATPTNPPATPTPVPATPTPLPAGQNALNIRVKTSNDDAEEYSGGSVHLNSTDLELIYDTSSQVVGLRFAGVNLPRGAKIVNAYIQFKVDEKSADVITLKIQGEASTNAATFTKTARNISARPRTASTVTWTPPAWTTVGAAGSDQTTPNLTAIIQELVNQPNWTSGNAMVIIITGTTGKRVAKAYDSEAAGAPLLHIEYALP